MSNIILSEINKLASKKENSFKFKKALKVIKSRETIINERMKDFLINGKEALLDFTDIYSTNRIGLHNNIHSTNGVGLHDKFYKEKTTI